MQNTKPFIIGITGQTAAGKNAVLEKLAESLDFKHYSVRSYLVGLLDELGLPENRKNLGDIATSQRKKHGASHNIKQIVETNGIDGKENVVIESIRNPEEVKFLRKDFDNFILLSVVSDSDERIKRTKVDPDMGGENYEKMFTEQEQRENDLQDKFGQQISECVKLADYTIDNSYGVEELESAVDAFITFLSCR